MRAQITGRLVDTDVNEWDMNGKKGITFTAFVVTGTVRDAPERVRVTASQYGNLITGSDISWPVEIRATANDFGRAKLRIALAEDFDVTQDGGGGLSAA